MRDCLGRSLPIGPTIRRSFPSPAGSEAPAGPGGRFPFLGRRQGIQRRWRCIQIQLSNSQVSSVSRADIRRSSPSVFLIALPKEEAERRTAHVSCGVPHREHAPVVRRPVSPYGAPLRRLKNLGPLFPSGPGFPFGPARYFRVHPRLRSQPGGCPRTPGTTIANRGRGRRFPLTSVFACRRSSGERERRVFTV